MDLTCLLPYEILQHVASSLLPRYQCRFALVSKWCYRYLYNDLLKWHARKAPIRAPKYTYVNENSTYASITQYNNMIVIYECRTSGIIYRIIRSLRDKVHHNVVLKMYNRNNLIRRKLILGQSASYAGSKIISHCVGSIRAPLFSIPKEILSDVLEYMDNNCVEDRYIFAQVI